MSTSNAIRTFLDEFTPEMWEELQPIQHYLDVFTARLPEKSTLPGLSEPRITELEGDTDEVMQQLDSDMRALLGRHGRRDLIPVWAILHESHSPTPGQDPEGYEHRA